MQEDFVFILMLSFLCLQQLQLNEKPVGKGA